MEVDVLDLIVAHAEEQLMRFVEAAVETSATLDELFAEGCLTTAPEYVDAARCKDEAMSALVGASEVHDSVVCAVNVARRLRGEDPYKVDRDRWQHLTENAIKGLTQRAADTAVMARAQEALRNLGRDKPQ